MRRRWYWSILVVLVAALGGWLALAPTKQAPAPRVLFYAWGGNPATNDYLRWASQQLAAQGIDLQHVKVADIAEVVKQLREGQTAADLLWINGENFQALKEAQQLRKIDDDVPNIALVRDDLPWQSDFGEAVDGLELPWGVGQFHLLVAADHPLATQQQLSAGALLQWAQQAPGRLSYPRPPEFHGTTFLKALLLAIYADSGRDRQLFQQPADSVDSAQALQPLWDYLAQLHPLLWQQGQQFPSSAGEQLQWFANDRLALAVSFNPQDAYTLPMQQRVPGALHALVLGPGAITNYHYLAVPRSARQPEAALAVINFLLSPAAQARKAASDGWGDPAVVPLPQEVTLLPVAAEFHSSWHTLLEQGWQQRYQVSSP